MGGIIATDFKFLSLALSSALQNAVSAKSYSWCVFFAPGTVAASYLESEGCKVGAKAAFHSSQHSGCPQAFLQGGNRQDYACLLVSLVAKDYLQCKWDSSHCEQCAYWAVLWCLASETDFANKREEEVVVLLACGFFNNNKKVSFSMSVIFILLSFSCHICLICCLLDTH